MAIQMVDLKSQYEKIKTEIDTEIHKVIDETSFINGSKVKEFAGHLAEYCHVKHVIPCANGTDALQIALMSLNLEKGDEIIVPAFTYVASAEVIGLLGYTPVMVDVDYDSFNVTLANIKKALSPKTKVIIPVHLFGQSCDMEPILTFAQANHLYVIEDNAQALGAVYKMSNGLEKHTGTMGTLGCTSFFPSKNLGCFGDGGAIMTDDAELAEKCRIIANHGQTVKYQHDILGCNSRLDTLQAAILDVKLKYLDDYCKARYDAAQYYTKHLKDIPGIITPYENTCSTHVYHQYTLKVTDNKRDELKKHLNQAGIPAMIYYPLPLQQQKAFQGITRSVDDLSVAEQLSKSVLSLPIHTEITADEQDFIMQTIKNFFNG